MFQARCRAIQGRVRKGLGGGIVSQGHVVAVGLAVVWMERRMTAVPRVQRLTWVDVIVEGGGGRLQGGDCRLDVVGLLLGRWRRWRRSVVEVHGRKIISRRGVRVLMGSHDGKGGRRRTRHGRLALVYRALIWWRGVAWRAQDGLSGHEGSSQETVNERQYDGKERWQQRSNADGGDGKAARVVGRQRQAVMLETCRSKRVRAPGWPEGAGETASLTV